MKNLKIILLCCFIPIILTMAGCGPDTVPSTTPVNEEDLQDKQSSIYFLRENGIYKYFESPERIEFLFFVPHVYHFIVDESNNLVFYGTVKDDQYSFWKKDIISTQETLIADNVGFMGSSLYENSVFFYDFKSGYVMEYKVQTGDFIKYKSSYGIDGNGGVQIYNGNIYFFSSKLHQIFNDDSGTKTIASRDKFIFEGTFYGNCIFYMDELDGSKDGIVKLNLDSGQRTIVDSFEVEKIENEIDDGKVLSDYFLIQDDTIYYSYNNSTYKISVDGNNKQRIADFPIMGDMYMINGKLLWYYSEFQDLGVGGPHPFDSYELRYFNPLTYQVGAYAFYRDIPANQAYEDFLKGNAYVQFRQTAGDTSYYKLDDLYSDDRPLQQFSIFDMNKDNIAELHLISNNGYNVVTWKDSHLFLIHQGTAYEKPLFNGAILYTRSGGAPTHIDYQYITLDFESMKSTAVSFQKYQSGNEDYDNESAYDTFYFDGNAVSKDKWYQLTNQYLSYFPAQIVWVDFPGKTGEGELIPRFMPVSDTYDGFTANDLNALGLTGSDLQLAGIPLGIAESEITKYIAEKPMSVVTKQIEEYAGKMTRIYTYSSGLVLLLSDPENKNEWNVFRIETTSSAHKTLRGLKVSDSINTVKKRYGEPDYGDDKETTRAEDDEWDYADERGAYTHVTFTVKNGIVVKISVFLAC